VPLEDALAFLGEARRDEMLGRELEALDGEATWPALVRAASAAGFDFTAEELQCAHALDWGLRWARYSGGTRASPQGLRPSA
jgi:predicted ribosomally synthesized peptide with nif11-like leader